MRLNLHILLIPIFFLFSYATSFAQDDCTVKLREAQKLYEEGKIEKVPDLIDNCIESGFNKENKVTALRLLTLVYLYEDNLPKAEETLLRLLKVQPEYKVNHNVDPIEFVRLFASYNTKSVFSVGLIGGGVLTSPRLIQTYSVYDYDKANPDYSAASLGISIGIKGIYHLNSKYDLVFEPKFTSHSFTINEEVTELSNFSAIEKMAYIDFPISATYKFYSYREFDFFAEAGAGFSILLSDELSDPITEYPEGENNDIKSSSINRIDYRNKYLVSGILGAGIKYNMKRDNVQLNFRYNMGFNNVVDEQSLSDFESSDANNELLNKHKYQENMFSVSGFSFLISYNREFYIHKKKK